MEEVVEPGHGRRARRSRVHRRRQDRHRAEGRQRPVFARPTTTRRSSGSCPRATRPSRSSWSIDSPHGRNLYYGGSVAAPIFQRIADAALRHQGVPPSINPAPPVLVARREESRERPTSGPAQLPAIVTLRRHGDGSAALFPDLRGLGARDALRMLARLGLTARVHRRRRRRRAGARRRQSDRARLGRRSGSTRRRPTALGDRRQP